jgi:hypothetical protein
MPTTQLAAMKDTSGSVVAYSGNPILRFPDRGAVAGME